MAFFSEGYDHVIALGDPRLKESFIYHTPLATISVIIFYLLSVYVFLPAFMKNRKAYSLKNVIYYYNIAQIVICLYLIFQILTPLSDPAFDVFCQPMNYSTEGRPMKILKIACMTYLLKAFELVETIFFVLRKKTNQVSKLHVYHHVSTLSIAWFFTKYQSSGMLTFNVLLNSFIHVLMYAYYLLASLETRSPEFHQKLRKWKPLLTMMQMIQFCVLILHASQVVNPDCKIPRQFIVIYFPNMFLIFYMFWQFYKRSYLYRKVPMHHS